MASRSLGKRENAILSALSAVFTATVVLIVFSLLGWTLSTGSLFVVLMFQWALASYLRDDPRTP